MARLLRDSRRQTMISRLEQGSLVTVFGGSGFVGRHAVEAQALDDEGPALAAAIDAGVKLQ
jgi:hypothetical protein